MAGQAICGANKKNSEGVCKLGAGYATDHLGYGNCKWHGGSTTAGIIYATRQKIKDDVQLGGPIDIDPHAALLLEVKRTAGHVEWLGARIRELGDDELIESGLAGKHPQVYIRWYQDERDRLVRVASMAVKAGVAERQVALAEEQGKLLAGAIRLILQGLGLTPEQERRAPGIVRTVLQTLPIEAGVAA